MLNTIMLLGTLTAILLGIGWFFFGYGGLITAIVISIVLNVLTYWFSDSIVLRMYKAKPLEDSRIHKMVEKLARDSRIPVPRLYLINTEIPNAFATGRSPGHSAVAVTKGLLRLENYEVMSVLAHEIGHVKHRDTLVSTMAATLAGAISFLAQIGYYSMFFGDSRNKGGGNLVALLLIIIFAPLAALLVRLAISRGREFKADKFAGLVTKSPESLASALRKISAFSSENPVKGNSATSHMWIINPFKADGFTKLFSTHPPVEERIERLERMDVK